MFRMNSFSAPPFVPHLTCITSNVEIPSQCNWFRLRTSYILRTYIVTKIIFITFCNNQLRNGQYLSWSSDVCSSIYWQSVGLSLSSHRSWSLNIFRFVPCSSVLETIFRKNWNFSKKIYCQYRRLSGHGKLIEQTKYWVNLIVEEAFVNKIIIFLDIW